MIYSSASVKALGCSSRALYGLNKLACRNERLGWTVRGQPLPRRSPTYGRITLFEAYASEGL